MAKKPEKFPAFTPYYTEEEAAEVRAAFLNAGKPRIGDASISEFIVRATMREVKRLERKFNDGKPWPPVPAGELRRGQRTMDEMRQRDDRK